LEREASVSVERVADLMRQIMRLQRRGSPEDWTALDLTMAQMKVLFVLHNEGSAKVSDLAEALSVSAPSMTGTLDRLVRQGFVARRSDASDRRLVIVVLTPAGQSLVERLHQGKRARLAAALNRLDDESLGTLEQGLTALRAAFEAGEQEAAPLRAAGTKRGGLRPDLGARASAEKHADARV
jgi:DNA-binding MarR family transcriptional regulator